MKKGALVFFLLFFSCVGRYYKSEDLRKEKSDGYLFASYYFVKNFSYLPSRLGLTVESKSDLSTKTYFVFDKEKGFILLPLKVGNYKISSISLFSSYTYEVYDSRPIDFSFEIEKDQILYLGNLNLNLSFDVEYIYWGVSNIVDNFEEDKYWLIKNNNEFQNYKFNGFIVSNLIKIRKLKYSPASPSNF